MVEELTEQSKLNTTERKVTQNMKRYKKPPEYAQDPVYGEKRNKLSYIFFLRPLSPTIAFRLPDAFVHAVRGEENPTAFFEVPMNYSI